MIQILCGCFLCGLLPSLLKSGYYPLCYGILDNFLSITKNSYSSRPLTRHHSYIFLIRVCDDHSATWHFYYSWNFSCEQKWVFTRTNLLFLPIFMSGSRSFSDQQVSVSQVIGRLVHHIGSMSLHQLHELHQTPLAGFVLHSQSLDPDYLQRVCDILDKAVSNRHEETILCTLIILQVSYHDDHTLYPHHLTV